MSKGASSQVLVINTGSSSLKYELIDPGTSQRLAAGTVDRIGESGSLTEHRNHGRQQVDSTSEVPDHEAAFAVMLESFALHGPSLDAVDAVGHRVVTAGGRYDRAALVDDEVCEVIEAMSPLAPLHNPANLTGIRLARTEFHRVPHVAVFDTAYFAHLPEAAATYAVDREVAARHGLRRNGAHGISHRYVVEQVRGSLGAGNAQRVIVAHLGNGASASAVVDGSPVETSMGVTPLEGLVMGTRSGDIDPAVPGLLVAEAALSSVEVDELLNRRSGMLGLCGHRDMRDVHRAVEAGDADAAGALEVYLHRLRKYIGAYAAVMGGIDVLAFTAGVGENDPVVRAGAVRGLGFLGLEVDPALNTGSSPSDGDLRVISPPGAAATVAVVDTDEELAIAREVMELLSIP